MCNRSVEWMKVEIGAEWEAGKELKIVNRVGGSQRCGLLLRKRGRFSGVFSRMERVVKSWQRSSEMIRLSLKIICLYWEKSLEESSERR